MHRPSIAFQSTMQSPAQSLGSRTQRARPFCFFSRDPPSLHVFVSNMRHAQQPTAPAHHSPKASHADLPHGLVPHEPAEARQLSPLHGHQTSPAWLPPVSSFPRRTPGCQTTTSAAKLHLGDLQHAKVLLPTPVQQARPYVSLPAPMQVYSYQHASPTPRPSVLLSPGPHAS